MNNASRRRGNCAGITMFEAVAGLAAIGAALLLANRATLAIDRQWRLIAQERFAMETIDLVMEQATTLSADVLSPERLEALSRSLSLETLPGGQLTAELTEEQEPLPAKRIVWTIAWKPHARSEPVYRRLAAWVYAEEAAP